MTDGSDALIVAIDGPSGVGKTTVARALAERLGVPYLETGAMYRALGLKVLESRVDPEDRGAVERLVEETEVRLEPGPAGQIRILVGGEVVGDAIRRSEVSEVTSQISTYPGVRRRMVELQRRCASRSGAVVEGRDIGTMVFPGTPHKFFLDAPAEVRARRRFEQLRSAGDQEVRWADVVAEVSRRDFRDTHRADSPLLRDPSYVTIDTSGLSPEAVVERILDRIREGRRAGSSS